MKVRFTAPEYRADTSFAQAELELEGSPQTGWTVRRNGAPHLSLGPGYRLLRTQACGVCSTDLARHFLPFPLPQVTGHEVLALDEADQRCVVEINASHQARGIGDGCPFCAQGLATHCPSRLVLGIHDLPGGFGPWFLAPEQAVLRVPDSVPSEAAVLVEPFAAALHAVQTVAPQRGQTVAVLGPRRLGLLVVAALAAWRRTRKIDFAILALARRREILDLAQQFGATRAQLVGGASPESPLADVVIDTTGSPEALPLAVALARHEVHLKSTHGRPSGGLAHLTELVVDELRLGALAAAAPERLGPGEGPRVAWLARSEPPAWLVQRARLLRGGDARSLRALAASSARPGELPRADAAVVDTPALADAAIRPDPRDQDSLVRPRGYVLFDPSTALPTGSPLADTILGRDLRLTSSRCGDFAAALELLANDPECSGIARLVTHRFGASQIAEAFAVARSPACVKAIVCHPGAP